MAATVKHRIIECFCGNGRNEYDRMKLVCLLKILLRLHGFDLKREVQMHILD